MWFVCRIARSYLIAALVASGLAMSMASAQAPIWQNDWTSSAGRLNFQNIEKAGSAQFSADGELVLVVPSAAQMDQQVIRVSSNGALRWSANIGDRTRWTDFDFNQALYASADGSAYLAIDNFSKIDASGQIAWTRLLSVLQIQELSPQKIVTLGCSEVSAISSNVGQLLWQHPIPLTYDACSDSQQYLQLAVDDQQNTYFSYQSAVGDRPTSSHLIKLDSSGNAVWDIIPMNNAAVTKVSVSGSLIYVQVNSPSTLLAVRTGDGSTAWTVPGNFLGLVGNPAEAVVMDAQVMRRLTATGSPRWTQPAANKSFNSTVINGALLLGLSQLEKIDAETGASLWSTSLPMSDASGNSLTFAHLGGLSDGSLLAVGSSSSIYSIYPWPFLQHIDFNSGQLIEQLILPAVDQGVIDGSSIADDGSHVISVAAIWTPQGIRASMRRINTADGSAVWTATMPGYYSSGFDRVYAAVAGNAVAMSQASYGQVIVGLFDRNTGAQRWVVTLHDPGQLLTYSFEPAVDADGNVFVALGTNITCTLYNCQSSNADCGMTPEPQMCGRLELLKLSATDGSILWHYNDSLLGNFEQDQQMPPTFALIGSDVLLGGPFMGPNAGSTIIRLSGVDGSLQWASNVMGDYFYSVSPLDDGNVILTGRGWTKLDGTTGQTLWNSTHANDCHTNCDDNDYITLTNGDMLFVGQANNAGRIKKLYGDGSSNLDSWSFPSNYPLVHSVISQIKKDSLDRTWVKVSEWGFVGLQFLARFDNTSGTLSGQQFIGSYAISVTKNAFASLLSAPENNRLLISTDSVNIPLPSTTGVAMLDTTVRANGDLTLNVTTDAAVVSVGDTLEFHIVATYTGDVAVTGAHVLASLPWSATAANLTCTAVSGSNCVIDNRLDNLQVKFDIQPGGHIEISGQLPVGTGQEKVMLNAATFGPISLSESNTVNNFGQAAVTQSLFRNGFE